MRNKIFWFSLLGVFVLALIILSLITGKIVEWLWMKELGYAYIFWKFFFIKTFGFALAFILVFFYFWVNLRLILKTFLKANRGIILRGYNDRILRSKGSGLMVAVFSFLPALLFGLIFYTQWDIFFRFWYGGTFGQSDPIFGKDLGFYLFRLPFYELIQNSLTGLTILTILPVTLAYGLNGFFRFGSDSAQPIYWPAIRHLVVLFLLFLGAWLWGYYLDRFELLYSRTGVVYGVGYTAYNVTRISLWIMFFASLVLAVFVAASLLGRRFKRILFSVGCYFVFGFIMITILPWAVQKFTVEPSELELETPFLKNNIAFTRKGFQLDNIEVKTYPAVSDLTLNQISEHQQTIENIRLWDWRPILQTFRQTQEIRLYYEFYEVDVDRYHLENGYHQVMLSARELAPQLPEKARTWVNEKLQFTHGFGLVMNYVSKSTEGGLPQYIISDIPPVTESGISVTQPAIYYGEKTAGYRIVSSQVKEFDYPKGSENVYASYQGRGGILLDNLWKRLLFSWHFSDINILLTAYLDPDSRIQLWRRVQERVSTIAPFLQLDHDPYLVVSKGKMYWIQDAYTTSDRFPYSEPIKTGGSQLNYIRNSVKILVDLYDGSVQFYIMDPNDPVLRVYREAFPGVFKDLKELSEDLKSHLRYPEDLFSIQADAFRTYHMTDPQVFYNREDYWTFAQEKYAGSAIPMTPYYILMRLPGSQELMYLLMTPFTPEKRDNMIAWMAAKCDFPEYGKILLYQLPKEKLVLGPIQIEALIDQNTTISEQLSLWDQRGSRVIRGNLIIIPIDNAFLYVEPVYLTAEGTNIPQLKRIIVASGGKVVMEPTLDQAIQSVFGTVQPEQKMMPASAEIGTVNRARKELEEAQKAVSQGNWPVFGEAMGRLKKLLQGNQGSPK